MGISGAGVLGNRCLGGNAVGADVSAGIRAVVVTGTIETVIDGVFTALVLAVTRSGSTWSGVSSSTWLTGDNVTGMLFVPPFSVTDNAAEVDTTFPRIIYNSTSYTEYIIYKKQTKHY